ncbi:MAG: hypothetical protein PW843_27785 [Azospirillaceae bacterium]|nr:hypothetical protein [Azospirillaceae bacterium]
MRRLPNWSFQYITGSKDKGAAAADVRAMATEYAAGRFKHLFSVNFFHSYYNGNHDRCPDLQAIPTPETMELMQSQALVMRPNQAGFSVYVDEMRITWLRDYLLRQGAPIDNPPPCATCPPDEPGQSEATARTLQPQYWTRLSFAVTPMVTSYVSLTAMPIDLNPTILNGYGCNNTSHRLTGQDTGDIRATFHCDQGDDWQFVTRPQFPMAVPTDALCVDVYDISGQVVHCQKIRPDDPPDDYVAPHYAQVNLGSLPMGLYKLQVQTMESPPPAAEYRLYTIASPTPLYFLDILFSQPADDSQYADGVYPYPPLFSTDPFDPARVGDIQYNLYFEARPTQWRYYVVSQSPGGILSDLKIEGRGMEFVRRNDVRLPTGEVAAVLDAIATLPLKQHPPERFRLRGRRRAPDGHESEVRMDFLPAAPSTPVWPNDSGTIPDPLSAGLSEMFVYV